MGLLQQRDWHIMGFDYGLFPYENAKFEASDNEGSEQFGHVAKGTGEMNILIEYDSDELEHT